MVFEGYFYHKRCTTARPSAVIRPSDSRISTDIRAANKLPININLRNRWPVGIFFNSLADFVVFQNINC